MADHGCSVNARCTGAKSPVKSLGQYAVLYGSNRGRMKRRYSNPKTEAHRDSPATSCETSVFSTPSCTMWLRSPRSLFRRRRICSGRSGSFASLQRIGSRTFNADEELKDLSPLKLSTTFFETCLVSPAKISGDKLISNAA